MEYTNASGAYRVNEDGEEDMNAGMQDTSMMGSNPSMSADAGMQDTPMMGSGASMGADTGMQDTSMMGSDASMGADPNMGSENGVEGFNPQGSDVGMQDTSMTGEEDEEVIDVDELVNKQEETAQKIDKLSSSFERLMDKMNDFKDMVNSSNERIESLKSELEKRNPTPVEKLSLRSKDSYPYADTPGEFWNAKQDTSNYSIEDDNNGANDPQYQITKDEIDNFNDFASVAKSLDDDYGLRDMFGY